MATTRKSSSPRPSPRRTGQRYRVRLIAAIHRFSEINGRAQWMNGYRAGNPRKEAELHGEEMRRWGMVGDAEQSMRAALTAYVRALNAQRKD